MRLAPICFAATMFATGPAFATEGGGSTYPRGVENFMVGAAPPPGLHWLAYGNIYRASALKDFAGNDLPIPGFKLDANVLAIRPVWSTNVQIAGGNLVAHAIIPLVDLTVSIAGRAESKSGIGDITVGPGIAFHHSPTLHSVVGLDFVLPTGSYDRTRLVNVGRNYMSVQPLYAFSHIDPNGFNGDFKLTLNLNGRNGDTDYKSGTEVFVDYSTGWGFGNGWTAGAGGYLWRQLSADEQAGVKLPNSKVSAFAIGPSVKYDNGKGVLVTAKLQRDVGVRNTTQGTAFWVKAVLPF